MSGKSVVLSSRSARSSLALLASGGGGGGEGGIRGRWGRLRFERSAAACSYGVRARGNNTPGSGDAPPVPAVADAHVGAGGVADKEGG